ncbi:Uncharacterized protein APZ42_005127 [Daphnia magna]|uniref:Uncharacterized protein n=1 Tax=Daphnia magna TaxID=35525 RepID=A0A162BYY4_9CRUS|nr:Uncharacterized protein APZ42_005127 [Daphnia magna]
MEAQVRRYLNLGFLVWEITDEICMPYKSLRRFMARQHMTVREAYSLLKSCNFLGTKSVPRTQDLESKWW